MAIARDRDGSVAMPVVDGVTARDIGDVFELPLNVEVVAAMVRAPGEPRPYRFGTHQGTDFYDVAKGTDVLPIATGIVVRADHDYVPMTTARRRAMLQRCKEVRGTPGEYGVPVDPEYGDVLDHLRGRQVWVYHGDTEAGLPVLSVYAHLSAVGNVMVGDVVGSEDVIGHVGNSGTSQEGVSDTEEMHLHLEVYVGAEYWTPRRPDELGRMLSESRNRELREIVLHSFRQRSD